MKYFLSSLLLVFIYSIFSCGYQQEPNKEEYPKDAVNYVDVKYAKGFTIEQHSNFKVITLRNAWKGEETNYQYVLYDNTKPKGFEGAVFVKTPIQSIACMSLTHIAFIDKLNQNNTITAISGCDYVSNSEIKEKIKQGIIKEIGQEQQLNYEMLIDNKPDVFMAYGINESSKKNLNKLKQLGLSVVLNAEYMENHPLGQAEWIKFIAAFYELDKEAAEIFLQIEQEYNELKNFVSKVETKPSVFVGMPWNGVWYLAGGESFQAQLMRDAGANYLWKDNQETSNFTVDKEVIIDKSLNSDYWINLNSYTTINEVIAYDHKFKNFKAVKNQQLFNNNKRVNSLGGNDFWESGVINPQLILKDLVTIFHPELIDEPLYYYKKLD
tara:strand:- start:1353 stop:2495 length:1143 start_codon:yes stop_codon:yes gene_type:complete